MESQKSHPPKGPQTALARPSYFEKFSKAGQLDEANLGPMGFEEDDGDTANSEGEAGPSQACASPALHQGLLRATPPRPLFSHTPSPMHYM